MAETVYASFPTAIQCEQAAGALLDYGVRKEDISLVAHESLRGDSAAQAGTGAAGVGATTDSVLATPSPVNNRDIDNYREDVVSERADIEGSSKQGISVTTPADAAAGAAKGAGIGLGLGVLAGIAMLAVPGVGWVIGGGALATAIGGALGATAAGAAAGGVVGYLKDQGMPEHVAADYNNNITSGGAMLAVLTPSNNVDAATIQSVLQKYGATSVNAY